MALFFSGRWSPILSTYSFYIFYIFMLFLSITTLYNISNNFYSFILLFKVRSSSPYNRPPRVQRGSRFIALLILNLGVRRWSAPRPGRFSPGKDPVPLVQAVGWAEGRSGRVRKIALPPGSDPRTVQPVASRYTDWATRFTFFKEQK
jgi:hypothetical protein